MCHNSCQITNTIAQHHLFPYELFNLITLENHFQIHSNFGGGRSGKGKVCDKFRAADTLFGTAWLRSGLTGIVIFWVHERDFTENREANVNRKQDKSDLYYLLSGWQLSVSCSLSSATAGTSRLLLFDIVFN